MTKVSGTVYIKTGGPGLKITRVDNQTKKAKQDDITSKEKNQVRKELAKLGEVTRKEIFEAAGVFPFDFFPDKIIIDLNTVTIIKRYLLSRYVFPIHLEDIKTVRDNWGPFFASVEVGIRGYEKNPPKVNFLWHKDASRARRYINALMDLRRENIDLQKLKREEIISKLEEISNMQAEREPGMF